MKKKEIKQEIKKIIKHIFNKKTNWQQVKRGMVKIEKLNKELANTKSIK